MGVDEARNLLEGKRQFEVTGISHRTYVVDVWAESPEAAAEWFDTHPDELFNEENLIEEYDQEVLLDSITEVIE